MAGAPGHRRIGPGEPADRRPELRGAGHRLDIGGRDLFVGRRRRPLQRRDLRLQPRRAAPPMPGIGASPAPPAGA